MENKIKRFLSLVFALVMVFSMMPQLTLSAKAADTVTVYFQNNWLWTDVKVYFWGSTSATNPEWPGFAMEHYGNDGNYDIYKYEVPADVTGIIFSGIKDDGSGNRDQTPNIESGWKDGICYYMIWDNGNHVGTESVCSILEHDWASSNVCSVCNRPKVIYLEIEAEESNWVQVSFDDGFINYMESCAELGNYIDDVYCYTLPTDATTVVFCYTPFESSGYDYSVQVADIPADKDMFVVTEYDHENNKLTGDWDIFCPHTNVTETTKDATCTEAGSKVVTCDVCKEKLKNETLPAGHKFTDGKCTFCGRSEIIYVKNCTDVPVRTETDWYSSDDAEVGATATLTLLGTDTQIAVFVISEDEDERSFTTEVPTDGRNLLTVSTNDFWEFTGDWSTCGDETTPHAWGEDSTCDICGTVCSHNYAEGICTDCGAVCSHNYTEGICTDCGAVCSHTYVDGTCSNCNAEDADYQEPVSPVTLDIANGTITITETGYTQGNRQYTYTGSYILTGTATADQYYGITINGVADGAAITLKDLSITSKGPSPLMVNCSTTFHAAGSIKLDFAYGGALASNSAYTVKIVGDADIEATAPFGAINAGTWDIACNSLTLTSTNAPAAYVDGLKVDAVGSIEVTSAGNNAINCSNSGSGAAILTAGGDITLTGGGSSSVIFASSDSKLEAGGDIAVTCTGTGMVNGSAFAASAKNIAMTTTGERLYGTPPTLTYTGKLTETTSTSTETKCNHLEHSTDGVCGACGEIVGHSFVDGTCTVCGATCTDHAWGDDSTCDICGATCAHASHGTDGICKACGTTDVHNIDWNTVSRTTDVTCTIPGYNYYACSCGFESRSVHTEPAGHQYGEDGFCSACGIAERVYIVNLTGSTISVIRNGLQHNGWEENTTAEEVENGVFLGSSTTYYDGYKFQVGENVYEAPKDGKNFILTVTATDATWGVDTHSFHNMDGTCQICNQEVGHKFVDGKCTDCGTCEKHAWDGGQTCPACGYWHEHNYVEGTCTVCNCADPDYVASIYSIATVADLIQFAKSVNSGTTYEGKTVTLTADINLSETAWTPIGNGVRSDSTYTGNAFKGIFDGGDFTITGLTFNGASASSSATVGLFGVVDGGTVKNLKLAEVSITESKAKNVGAAVGVLVGDGIVDNVDVISGSISGPDGIGGVVGRLMISGTVQNCDNAAAVSATTAAGGAGGIVGKAYYTAADKEMNIISCTNSGAVSATYAGGIAGLSASNVTNCTNSGAISGTCEVGGIVGEQVAYGEISGNTNTGAVALNNPSGSFGVGGIVGSLRDSSASSYPNKETITIKENVNKGVVSVTGDYEFSVSGNKCHAGGILGYSGILAVVTDNTNEAPSITAGGDAGGIVGNVEYTAGNVTVTGNTNKTQKVNISGTNVNQIVGGGGNYTTEGGNEGIYAAKIGAENYESLQAAIDAVKDGETIVLVADCAETVTFTQTKDVSFVLDGNHKTMTGSINITARAGKDAPSTLVIKNFNFTTDKTSYDFIKSVETNYYPNNITIQGCSFTGTGDINTESYAVVAVRLKSANNILIKDCTGTGLHSFLQNTAGWNINLDNVDVTDSLGGFAMGTVQGTDIENCDLDVSTMGIRLDAQYNNNAVIEDCNVTAFIPVVVRRASVNGNLTFTGENTMTATNTDGLWCAIGTSEYSANGEKPTDPTGKVTVTLLDKELPTGGVHGEDDLNRVAPDGNAYDVVVNTSNLTLENSLAMNFWINKDDLKEGVDYYAVLTRGNDPSAPIPMNEWSNYNSAYYQIPYEGLAAKEMNDEISVQIFDESGVLASNVFTDSIRGYAEFKLNEIGEKTALTTALVDMLNYGAAAQVAFGVGGEPANAGLTAEQKSWASQSYADLADNWNGGPIGYGSNLELKQNIILHIWFKNVGITHAEVSFTDHYGTEVTDTVYADEFTSRIGTSIMSVAVDELVVADGRQVVTVVFYNGETKVGTVKESVASYINYMKEKDAGNELYEMTIKFVDSAKAYFDSSIG